MIIVCSWCGEKQGEKEPLKLETVTHTICARCKVEVSPKHVAEAGRREHSDVEQTKTAV